MEVVHIIRDMILYLRFCHSMIRMTEQSRQLVTGAWFPIVGHSISFRLAPEVTTQRAPRVTIVR